MALWSPRRGLAVDGGRGQNDGKLPTPSHTPTSSTVEKASLLCSSHSKCSPSHKKDSLRAMRVAFPFPLNSMGRSSSAQSPIWRDIHDVSRHALAQGVDSAQ